MIENLRNYFRQGLRRPAIVEKSSAEAYDLWSADYDQQPGNLMLDLDESLFPRLLENIIYNKAVADIGCGTGRHWPKIMQMKPASLTGYDTSQGMLHRLREKFPDAHTYKITDTLFSNMLEAAFDTIVSTLTVAHIQNIENAISHWCAMLKPSADVVITDFHPRLLAFGGRRTFRHQNERFMVTNYVHGLDSVKAILFQNGFRLISQQEIIIDETVRHYYAEQNALGVYERFKGFPVIYGIHLRRGDDPE